MTDLVLVRPMRCLVLLVVLLGIPYAGRAAELAVPIPEEELKGGATTTRDGFHVDFQRGADVEKTPDGKTYDTVWFLVGAIPRVGDTDLVSCTFMAFDWRGRRVAFVGIQPRYESDPKRPRLFDVTAERGVAKRCKLLFSYGARPMHNIVKDYIVPLADHLPPKR